MSARDRLSALAVGAGVSATALVEEYLTSHPDEAMALGRGAGAGLEYKTGGGGGGGGSSSGGMDALVDEMRSFRVEQEGIAAALSTLTSQMASLSTSLSSLSDTVLELKRRGFAAGAAATPQSKWDRLRAKVHMVGRLGLMQASAAMRQSELADMMVDEEEPPAPPRAVGRVRIWTGSWNMGARDPFFEMDLSKNQDVIRRTLENFIPRGYDIYVLGVQEAVSDAVFDAIPIFLKEGLPDGVDYYRLPLNAKLYPAAEDKTVGVRSRRMGRAVCVSELYDDAKLGHYPEPIRNSDDLLDRVLGRGDGAIIIPKFTGIGVFVLSTTTPYVRLLGFYKHSFGVHEGSKGGVGVALGVYDTTIAFVNSHMSAKRSTARRQQYMDLIERLGNKLGARGFQLLEQFHHVVWMGDMNFQSQGVNSDRAVELIERGEHHRLAGEFDELGKEIASNSMFSGFSEPAMAADFFPTYQKVAYRGRVDMSDPDWVRRVYSTSYKEPFYKGGRTVDRVPSYADRILWHSLDSTRYDMTPEPEDPSDVHSASNYSSVNDGLDVSDHSPVFSTWWLTISVDVEMSSFDTVQHQDAGSATDSEDEEGGGGAGGGGGRSVRSHSESEVALRTLSPGRALADPMSQSVNVILEVTDVKVDFKGQMRSPRALHLLFPLPYEDSNMLPVKAKVLRADKISFTEARSETREKLTGTIKSRVSRASRVEELHLLLKVSLDDDTKAQCVVQLKDGGLRVGTTCSHQFFEPLSSFGLPLLDRGGKPVNVQFYVTLSSHGDTTADTTGIRPALHASARGRSPGAAVRGTPGALSSPMRPPMPGPSDTFTSPPMAAFPPLPPSGPSIASAVSTPAKSPMAALLLSAARAEAARNAGQTSSTGGGGGGGGAVGGGGVPTLSSPPRRAPPTAPAATDAIAQAQAVLARARAYMSDSSGTARRTGTPGSASGSGGGYVFVDEDSD